MPIRLDKRWLYRTVEWRTARAQVLERCGAEVMWIHRPDREPHYLVTGGYCEWCGRPNGRWIFTSVDGTGRWWDSEAWQWVSPADTRTFRWIAPPAPLPEAGEFVQVQLGVAHLDHDPANNDLDNLAALCRRCHLRHDQGYHLASFHRRRDEETGQLRMEHSA